MGTDKHPKEPHVKQGSQTPNDGFDAILSQMFPQCPLNVIQAMLGNNPSKETAREVANELSSMDFPDTPNGAEHSKLAGDNGKSLSNEKDTNRQSHQKKSIMDRMIGGLRPSSAGGSNKAFGKRVVHQQAPEHSLSQDKPHLPENDAASQQSLEAMLQDSVQSTRSVQAAGVSAPETVLKSLPQGLECGSEGKLFDVCNKIKGRMCFTQ